MPSTPENQLKRAYQKEIAKSGLRIKVIEKTGTTLKSKLQVSNPFKPRHCDREGCFVCSSGGTGNCNAESITYEVECLGDCTVKDLYKGESAHNAFTRGKNTCQTLMDKMRPTRLYGDTVETLIPVQCKILK